MNRRNFGLAVIFLCLSLAHPGTASGSPSSNVPNMLMALETKWVTALAKRDTATLGVILASTYVDGDETGARTNKQGVLTALRSGDLQMQSIRLFDMRVNVYGDAAIIIGSAVQIGSYKGTPLTRNVVFTDTFVMRNGHWLAVASQRAPRSS